MIAVPGGFDGSGDLIRIANLKDLRAEVDINEADFQEISMGQYTKVIPDAYPGRTYPGRVVKIYPRVNRQRGTIKVEMKLENVDSYLRPDMSVRINFLMDVPQNEVDAATPQVLIPKGALHRQGENMFVWTVRKAIFNALQSRPAQTLEIRYKLRAASTGQKP